MSEIVTWLQTYQSVVQVVSWVVGSFGGVIAAAVAIYQMAANRGQRQMEQIWRQTEAGMRLIDAMNKDESTLAAMSMLEPGIRQVKDREGSFVEISDADLVSALQMPSSSLTQKHMKEAFIHECFDYLFTTSIEFVTRSRAT